MLAIAILAAGKGTRMKSSTPKVLHRIGGVTLLDRVLSSSKKINPDRRILIIGHQSEIIKSSIKPQKDLEFATQQPQNGTGHAVQQLIPFLKSFKGELIVLNGDVPLIKSSTLERLLTTHKSNKADVTILSARVSNPTGYGRVFLDKESNIQAIIEEKDCSYEQSQNTLTNSGVYCFDWEKLKKVLSFLSNDNSQKEIYLTDTVSLLSNSKHLEIDDPTEVSGINDKVQLARCENLLQERLKDYWMKEGVTFIDPMSCTISENCSFGKDVIIEPQTHLRDSCTIGNECQLGPNTFIQNSTIGNNVKILASVINNSRISDDVLIGPYAHLRPLSEISNNCKIGNFVELKKSFIGTETNISHLSYIGDSSIGNNVNIGAGTITANYDGLKKNRTIIGHNTQTGANSVLIAPINIGSNVTVGAGSTLTKDVPDKALAIERSKQITKSNWHKTSNNHK